MFQNTCKIQKRFKTFDVTVMICNAGASTKSGQRTGNHFLIWSVLISSQSHYCNELYELCINSQPSKIFVI